MIFLAFIRFPEGKKVFTKDGEHIGFVEKVYISEFGVHTAVIKTVFPEYPQFEVLMTQLKPQIMKIGNTEEEVYILKNVPMKIVMIIEEKKEEELRKQQEAQQEMQKLEETETGEERKESEEEKQETILAIAKEKEADTSQNA